MSDLRKLAEEGLANPWRKGETNFKHFHCRAALEQAATPDAILTLFGQIGELRAELELTRVKSYCVSISEISVERDDLLGKNANLSGNLLSYRQEIDRLRADAERYRWLRMRIKVTKMQAVSGSVRDALDIKTGCSFIDSPLPHTVPKSYPAEQADNLDAAIDSARAAS